MAHWSDKYVGIPFRDGGRDHSGCDCAGLVMLVMRQELGIVLTDTETPYTREQFGNAAGQAVLSSLIEQALGEWPGRPVRPAPFDLCRFRLGGNPCHVGLSIGGGMFLHAVEGAARAHVLSLASPQWARRFVEFRRHERFAGGAA